MNKLLPTIGALVAVGGLPAAAACTVNSTTTNNGPDSSTGDDDDSGSPEASPANDSAATDTGADVAPEAAPTPAAHVRFANWSPDSPSVGYDLCIAPHGTTTWQGPILSQDSGDAGVLGDGGSSALQFPTVSNYFEVDLPDDSGSSQYDVEIVSQGGTCSNPVGTAGTALPGLTDGGFFTFAIVGDTSTSGTNDKGLTVIGLADDTTASGSNASLRFVNAGPSIATADFGTGSETGTDFSALLTAVPFGATASTAESDAGTVDTNGYLSIAAASGLTFSVHPSSQTTDTATATGQTLAAGNVTTMVLIGAKTGVNYSAILVCTGDGAVVSGSLSSTCTVAPM